MNLFRFPFPLFLQPGTVKRGGQAGGIRLDTNTFFSKNLKVTLHDYALLQDPRHVPTLLTSTIPFLSISPLSLPPPCPPRSPISR